MENKWVAMKERLPTEEDADELGCVLVWDTRNGVKVCGVRNRLNLCREPVTHWMKMPERPVMEGKAIEAASD